MDGIQIGEWINRLIGGRVDEWNYKKKREMDGQMNNGITAKYE